MKFNFDENVEFILKKLNEHGKGYVVGGALRDFILGLDPEDYDFTTNIEFNKLKIIFKEYNPIEVGSHFGIIIIHINDKPYEIAKMREETGIYNSRHPKHITFVSDINRDLSRRDFTINALAYNHEDGLIDIFNSVEDIKKGIVRFIGNPKIRIEEDALRIMRAFRFVSKFDFKIEKNTLDAIKKKNKFINKISKERIFDELNRILMGKNPYRAFSNMKKSNVLETLIPDFKLFYNIYYNNENLFKHVLRVVQNTNTSNVTLKWAALLFQLGKIMNKYIDISGNITYENYENDSIDISTAQLNYFKAPKILIRNVNKLIKYQNIHKWNISKKELKKNILSIGSENLLLLKNLIEVNNESYFIDKKDILSDEIKYFYEEKEENAKKIKIFFDKVNYILENETPIYDRDVDLTGIDIIHLGFKKEEISKIKNEIYDLVLENVLPNKKRKIINYILNKYMINKEIKEEYSFGVVVYNINLNKYLLVKILDGNWGFPKGHKEKNETHEMAAIREVYEETGLKIQLHPNFEKKISYMSDNFVFKTVTLFLSFTTDKNIKIDENELEECNWFDFEESKRIITYKTQKDILKCADDFIKLNFDLYNYFI